jgi:2-methylisocitrate lyase-like PEP mutase family enzyme
MSIEKTCQQFHDSHASGCFVIPNPWDVGSAKMLEGLGFKALATTSSGCAWSQGRADHQLPLDAALAHFEQLAQAVTLPVSADFEGCFARQPEGVAENVTRAAATGLAGLSIEDASGDAEDPLYEMPLALERVQAARAALDADGKGLLLTARTEGFLLGRSDLDESLRRLTAFAEAGADCLYAPGIKDLDTIRTLVEELAPKPVNVLASAGFTVDELARIGVRRISVGGALALVAWSAFWETAQEIAESGTFTRLGGGLSRATLEQQFNS